MKKNFHIVILSILFSIILWVSISLSNDYYATFQIPLRLENFPAGYTTGTDIPEKISVKLKGQGWKLVSFYLGRESDYVITAGKDSGKKFINLYNYLVDNRWLSSDVEVIDINPDTLSFKMEKIVSKKVEILSAANLNFKSGYGLASPVRISPESTVVYGPITEMRKIHSITTAKRNLKNLDTKVRVNIPLENEPGFSYKNNYVTIDLNVQKIVDKTFQNIPVSVRDVPKDRDVLLLPNQIDVDLRGGVDILAKISKSEIQAHVNYRDIVLDTLGTISPIINIPENTAMIFTKPDRLKYIIKKFN
jgi:YbbR domain-containing protein